MRPLLAAFLLLPSALCAAVAPGWFVHTGTEAVWEDNITNSNASWDVTGAFRLGADIGASRRFAVAEDVALIVSPALEIEWVPRFDGLSAARAGVDLSWQRKLGLGAYAPTFAIESGLRLIGAQESERSGWSGQIGISWNRRLDAQTRVSAAARATHEDLSLGVLDRTAGEISARIDRDFGGRWTATLDGLYRDGDLVSYAVPPAPSMPSMPSGPMWSGPGPSWSGSGYGAAPYRPVRTFGGWRNAYALSGQTWAGEFGVSYALSSATLVTVAYGHQSTSGDYADYVNHLVSLRWRRQF